jgi:hypothetical protein
MTNGKPTHNSTIEARTSRFASFAIRLSDFVKFATRNSSFDIVPPRRPQLLRMNTKSSITNLRSSEAWRASHVERVSQSEKKPNAPHTAQRNATSLKITDMQSARV